MKYLNYLQEEAFVQRISKNTDIRYYSSIKITDSLSSRRQTSNITREVISIIETLEYNEKVYLPIGFNFKKMGDEKHRLCMLITKEENNYLIELFDSNSWNNMLDSKKYRNKENVEEILKNVQEYFKEYIKIHKYEYCLNSADGYCVTLTLLFLLYRSNNIPIEKLSEILSFYESRSSVHYEKELNKMIKERNINYEDYHNTITNLINNEKKVKKVKRNKPTMC